MKKSAFHLQWILSQALSSFTRRPADSLPGRIKHPIVAGTEEPTLKMKSKIDASFNRIARLSDSEQCGSKAGRFRILMATQLPARQR